LARSPHLARLAELHLLGNTIGEQGSQDLLDSPYLTGLRKVDLRHNNLGRAQKSLWRKRLGAGVTL
jgi:hypothetical protein